MRRMFLVRYAPRSSSRLRNVSRPLTLEHLDARIVLTSGMDIPYLGPPPNVAIASQQAAMASITPTGESSDTVYGPLADQQSATTYDSYADGSTPTAPSEQPVTNAYPALPTSYPLAPPSYTPPPSADPYTPPTTLAVPDNPDPDEGASVVPLPGGGLTLGDPTGPVRVPPKITDLHVELIDGYWQFTGVVVDDQDVAGLEVQFGGLLSGRTARVNEEGVFSLTVSFPPGTTGGVTASTIDSDGFESNTVFTWVQV